MLRAGKDIGLDKRIYWLSPSHLAVRLTVSLAAKLSYKDTEPGVTLRKLSTT